jgi:hypothetical protein
MSVAVSVTVFLYIKDSFLKIFQYLNLFSVANLTIVDVKARLVLQSSKAVLEWSSYRLLNGYPKQN